MELNVSNDVYFVHEIWNICEMDDDVSSINSVYAAILYVVFGYRDIDPSRLFFFQMPVRLARVFSYIFAACTTASTSSPLSWGRFRVNQRDVGMLCLNRCEQRAYSRTRGNVSFIFHSSFHVLDI